MDALEPDIAVWEPLDWSRVTRREGEVDIMGTNISLLTEIFSLAIFGLCICLGWLAHSYFSCSQKISSYIILLPPKWLCIWEICEGVSSNLEVGLEI